MLKSVLMASAISILATSPLAAKKYYRPALLANNAGSITTTEISKATFVVPNTNVTNWVSQPSQTLSIPSSQKTIAATVKYAPIGTNGAEPMAAIMYRDTANGNINTVESISVSEDGAYNVTSLGSTPVIFANGTPFTNIAEEIEMDPISGDIFVLAINGNSRQIYRIDRNSNTVSVMTLYDQTNMNPTPNGNRIYWNTITGKYKNGSIAFVPNPQNSNEFLLAFTHESAIARYQFCTWYFKPVGDHLVGMPNSSGLNKCWGTNSATGATIPGQPTLASILRGTGLNTTYAEGKFVVARDNGPLMKIDWSGGTPSDTIKPLNDNGLTAPMNAGRDLAYWRNF